MVAKACASADHDAIVDGYIRGKFEYIDDKIRPSVLKIYNQEHQKPGYANPAPVSQSSGHCVEIPFGGTLSLGFERWNE